jgi:hypothetical protein
VRAYFCSRLQTAPPRPYSAISLSAVENPSAVIVGIRRPPKKDSDWFGSTKSQKRSIRSMSLKL